MRALEILIRTAILVVLVGGGGTIAGLVMRSDALRQPMMYVLLAGLAVTGAILAWATIIGVYHLFLYLFTNRRPLGFFATTSKDDAGDASQAPPG